MKVRIAKPEEELWVDPDYIRPSSLKLRNLCSAFTQDEVEERLEAAAQGTRIHAAMETGGDGDLEEEDLPLYQWTKEQRARLIEEEVETRGRTGEALREIKIAGAKNRYLGMVDELHHAGPFALLIDYKCGEWKVDDPEHNLQLQDYTRLCFHLFPRLKWIKTVVLAPKRGECPSHTFDRCELPGLDNRLRMLRVRLKRRRETPHRFCVWCARIGECKAVIKTLAPLRHQADDLPAVRGDYDLANPMDISDALNIRPVLNAFAKKFSDAVKEAASGFLEEGVVLPGWRLVDRRGRRMITDIQAMAAVAQNDFGLTKDEVSSVIEVSLKGIISAIREKQPRGKKKEAEQAFLQQMELLDALKYGDSYQVIEREKQ